MDALAALTNYFTKINIQEAIRPPPDCPRYRLSQILTAKKGRVPTQLTPIFNKSAKPYLNIKAFEHGIIEQYVESDDGVPVTADDLVMVWDGARCGLVGRGRNGVLGSTLKKLTLKKAFAHVPLPYLQYFLESKYHQLNTHSRGSVIQHVDPGLFWKLEVPIPEKDDDRFQRICTWLHAIEEVEQHTARQLQLVKKLQTSFLHEVFTP